MFKLILLIQIRHHINRFSISEILPTSMFSFEQVLNSSHEIKQFFIKHANTPQDCLKLATQLLIQSIRNQKSQQNPQKKQSQTKNQNTRYNVAYIKHNRFLSPSQKRQVTPKVTQIIPVSPQKIFIYGKPKVKLDNSYGCVLHQQNCEQYVSTQKDFRQKYQNQNQQEADQSDLQPMNHTYEIPRQYNEYLSPKNKAKKKAKINEVSSNQTMGTIRSPKNKNQQRTSNRMTSPKCFINQAQKNPGDYSNVSSKIKELIQRDKKNREIQKQVEQQRKQIMQIQQRQNRLFMMQKYQQNLLKGEDNMGQQHENEIWKITTTHSPQPIVVSGVQSDSQTQSSYSESEVNLHGHQGEQSRIECYECQIQRLRKRKHKAKNAIKLIEKEQIRRSKILGSIALNSQVNLDKIQNRSFEQSQSHNSIRIQ